MPNDLLSLAELQAYLGLPLNTDNDLLQALLDAAFDQLLTDTGRQGRPFQVAQVGRTEVRAGQVEAMLLLDYPVQTLTSVVLGLDPLDADETLVVNDPNTLVWATGQRGIVRTDCRAWGLASYPRYIHLTYDTQAFLPPIARAALMRATAQLYRNRGSEGASREKEGIVERDIISPFAGGGSIPKDTTWMLAVNSLWEPYR